MEGVQEGIPQPGAQQQHENNNSQHDRDSNVGGVSTNGAASAAAEGTAAGNGADGLGEGEKVKEGSAPRTVAEEGKKGEKQDMPAKKKRVWTGLAGAERILVDGVWRVTGNTVRLQIGVCAMSGRLQ